MSFGVMGGDNQAQAHAQVVMNFVDFGMHVQAAGDAARMRHIGESSRSRAASAPSVRAALEAPRPQLRDGRGQMGGYQAHPDRPEDRRADGRIRPAQGRPGHRLVAGA